MSQSEYDRLIQATKDRIEELEAQYAGKTADAVAPVKVAHDRLARQMKIANHREAFNKLWPEIRQTLINAQKTPGEPWPIDEKVRKSLWGVANEFCNVGRSIEWRDHMKTIAEQKPHYRTAAKQARSLTKSIRSLPHLAQYEALSKSLGILALNAERIAKTPPANVDVVRGTAWAQAATIYENVTGRPVSVYDRSNRRKTKLPPDNPFVRFLRAFADACPGEPQLDGDAAGQWFRKHWKPWKASLTGDAGRGRAVRRKTKKG